ncbi:MAG: radical SAM protein [Desulfuromonadaceae bacterium]|nr:radical SAM protein [Desulfuromonadaceae bacterium]MDD2847431.1 radical SAM protein [Desulfuromonadaceae bacterium]MDD4131456.1 radical SAM protein [Desulfuromonadaceae bacterium]
MKIVIVENPRPLTAEHYNDVANAPLSASLNSGYALAVARRAGWETAYMDFTADHWDEAATAEAILAEDGDIVLFHWVYSWGYEEFVRSVLELLSRNSKAALGAFGLFPTLASARLQLFAPPLDFVLVGEFEDTLSELLPLFTKRRAVAALPGVHLRGGSYVARPLIADLSLLPAPDDVGANCAYTSLNVAASRGCYGACSFCFIHRYYGCSRRRVRDLVSLERELETRLARRNVESLYFIDPTFIGQGDGERGRAREIGEMAQRFGLPFGFETRVDGITDRLLATLAECGATSLFLGIESGCDSVLRRIGKRISTEQIRRVVRAVQNSGIELHLGFIMFEPDSTMAELQENYDFLEELGLLDRHELTANLLYHNQIVLYGSAAWERFGGEGRLLLEERLPFEARYRFRDERVGHVCTAMGRLTSAYFAALGRLRQEPSAAAVYPGSAVNALLKEAFRALCNAAQAGQSLVVESVEAECVARLQRAVAL